MPSTRPSRAVTAVERNVLLNRGHQAGLCDRTTRGMAQNRGPSSTVAPYRTLDCRRRDPASRGLMPFYPTPNPHHGDAIVLLADRLGIKPASRSASRAKDLS